LGALSLSLLSCDGVGDTAPPASPPVPVAALLAPAVAVDPPINLSNTSETTLEDSAALLDFEPAVARLRTLSVIGATTAVVDCCVAAAETTGVDDEDDEDGAVRTAVAVDAAMVAAVVAGAAVAGAAVAGAAVAGAAVAAVVAVVAAAEVAGCTTLLFDDRVAGGVAAERPGDNGAFVVELDRCSCGSVRSVGRVKEIAFLVSAGGCAPLHASASSSQRVRLCTVPIYLRNSESFFFSALST